MDTWENNFGGITLSKERLLILLLYLCFFCFSSGEVIVELYPKNITVSGEFFNLDLVVKNIPPDTKCGGFEAKVKYDSNLLSLTNIQLSDIGKNADLKDVNVSNGWISLLWFSNNPYGNFTIATLTFKATSSGNTTIFLDDVSVSDENGYKYQVSVSGSVVTINNINKTFSPPDSYLLIKDFEYNKSITGKLTINNTVTPINKINGTILLKNIQLLGIEPNNDACKEFSYKKSITKGLYSGLAFYGEHNYNQFYLEYGEIKNLSLIAYNVEKNITYISGCIYINVSENDTIFKLKFLSNKSIYKIEKVYKNNTWIGCYLYFNASPNKAGTFEIANIRITPNSSISVDDEYNVYLIDVTAYSGNEKIDLQKSSFKIAGISCNNPYGNNLPYSVFLRSEIFMGNYTGNYTDISYGDVKLISFLYRNDTHPITTISGKIYINSSLLNVLDYDIAPEMTNNIKYKSINLTGDYLYFNLTFNNPITRSRILCIKVTPKINADATTLILANISQNFPISNLKVNIFRVDFSALPPYYYGTVTNLTFSYVPDDAYQNCSELSILNLNLKFFENWKLLMDIYQNGIKTNSSVIISKKTTTTTEINNTIQIDAGYITGTSIEISYGENPTLLYLRLINVKYNITNISGYIFMENSSLVKIDDVSICNETIDKVSYENISFNESSIFFNLSFKQPISGNVSLLMFHIEAKVDTTADTSIYLSNLTIYSNTTKINLTVRNMTVHVLKRKTNNPPELFVAFNIINNKEVHFYAFGYDKDNDRLKYFWEFGDGSNSTDKDPVHRYADYSEYVVRCIVRDAVNGTDEVKFIINIANLSPIIYNLSDTQFYIGENESSNKTVYLNISLNNPFPYPISGYIDFENFIEYQIPKHQYKFDLLPNETINLTIPVNVSKSTTIEWNVKYYVAYPNRFSGNSKYQLLYYEWRFKNSIKFSKKPVVKIYEYTKTISLNNSNIILKISKNKIFKDYIVEKVISVNAIPKKDVVYYCIISLVGFMLGMGLIRRIK